MSVEMRKAKIAAVVEHKPGKSCIMLGEGDHTAHRWELTDSLAAKLLVELFGIVMKSRFRKKKPV